MFFNLWRYKSSVQAQKNKTTVLVLALIALGLGGGGVVVYSDALCYFISIPH